MHLVLLSSRLPLRVLFAGLTVAFICPLVSAQEVVDSWRYTLRKPSDGWQTADFDAAGWKEGDGGFGTRGTPRARVATDWSTKGIWLRKSFSLDFVPRKPALLIHHDEDTEVFVNGVPIARFTGFVTQYKVVPLNASACAALRSGTNLLAVHCRQTRGGQFIDVHVVDADNVPKLPAPKRPTVPFKSDLITQWGEQVTANNAWQEYPRPQLVRGNWRNLNGYWDYAITAIGAEKPKAWDGEILVPFAIESKLSGVQRLLNPEEALWYHRTIELGDRNRAHRVRLNFEAVDYRCRVWLNDVEVGQHMGGNLPFSFDITDAITNGTNHLVVRVEDATGGAQLRGKQQLDPHGIWYTRVSGIWQTVWLEEVPRRHVQQLKFATDIKAGSVSVRPILHGEAGDGESVRVVVSDGDRIVAEGHGGSDGLSLTLKNAKLWSPSDPHLYDVSVSLLDSNAQVIDEVASYVGLREVGTKRDADGHLRFTLNGKTVFHWGPLDQGWWPDGLLTPPSDEAMQYEIRFLKDAGFNMIRKHIKVEPRRYYYHCDRLGMMVWQDQVSGGAGAKWTFLAPNPTDAKWKQADHEQFMRELAAMMDVLDHFPSIVVWVPFNEAWGQHRTMQVGKWTAENDPTRLVNIASGGNFWPVGHIVDRHNYPHPTFPFDPARFADYVKVVGEFGGHGWPVEGHLWDADKDNWGYGGLPKTVGEYEERYRKSIRLLAELQAQGVAGGVYTQTTDVEGEINGLMTYDRKVIKIPTKQLSVIHRLLFEE